MPCFCLRHDVDALLWQPHSSKQEDMWEHIATFNALGIKLALCKYFPFCQKLWSFFLSSFFLNLSLILNVNTFGTE